MFLYHLKSSYLQTKPRFKTDGHYGSDFVIGTVLRVPDLLSAYFFWDKRWNSFCLSNWTCTSLLFPDWRMPLFFKKLNATSAFASLYRTSIWKFRFSRLSLNDLLIYFMLRYHYNVADARLAQHVERGIADGLLISCVASCSNLWALIMDAGTGFTSQVYELSPFFLHKVNFCATDAHIVSLFILGVILVKQYSNLMLVIHRNGSWNNGKRTITSALSRVPTMGAPLWLCLKVCLIGINGWTYMVFLNGWCVPIKIIFSWKLCEASCLGVSIS